MNLNGNQLENQVTCEKTEGIFRGREYDIDATWLSVKPMNEKSCDFHNHMHLNLDAFLLEECRIKIIRK